MGAGHLALTRGRGDRGGPVILLAPTAHQVVQAMPSERAERAEALPRIHHRTDTQLVTPPGGPS